MTGSKPLVANVLANRYASPEMAEIWSAENKVVLERELWVAVLVAQKDLGIKIDDAVVDAYRSVMTDVDLESIDRRERVTLHDVKARIEEFSSLAGYEHIHKGLTSRDLTENVEQLQIKRSLVLTQQRPGCSPFIKKNAPAAATSTLARKICRDCGSSFVQVGAQVTWKSCRLSRKIN